MEFTNYTNLQNNTKIYFSEIKDNGSMTREDEEILFARIALGDKNAETEIFNKTAKFAVAIAKTYTRDSNVLEDLIQEANIGILDAIHRYDITTGTRFISFAVYYIKMRIRNFLCMNDTVNVPLCNTLAKVKKIRNDFFKLYGRDPETSEVIVILENMGISVKDSSIVRKISVSSMDNTMNDDEGNQIPMYETGEIARRAHSYNDFESDTEKEDISYQIKCKMSVLDEREKRFVKLFFGIGVFSPIDTFSISDMECAAGNKITPERVRQIVKGAIEKMRK